MKHYKLAHLITGLRRARAQQALTQVQLAKMLELPQSYVSDLERGTRDPRLTTFLDWGRVLGFELMLIPKHLVSGVNQIVTNTDNTDIDESPFRPLPEEV